MTRKKVIGDWLLALVCAQLLVPLGMSSSLVIEVEVEPVFVKTMMMLAF